MYICYPSTKRLIRVTSFGKITAQNNELASTKLFLFFATKSLYPCMSFDIIDLSGTNTHEQILKQKTVNISGNMKITWKLAQKAIVIA